MAAAIGLDIGLDKLGAYYDSPRLTDLAGAVTAFGVFFYITLMEVVSVMENFASIRPGTQWLSSLIRRLKAFAGNTEDDGSEYNNDRDVKNDQGAD